MENPISKIIDCQATECVYNKSGQCHTPAITVGDLEPCCDTFFQVKSKGGFLETNGGVGACKVSGCEYNDAFECTASGIHVVMNVDHPDCGTYKPRQK
ncbi:MAG: DUF1540 domain-containing protein [Fibrobacter sp.]|nr:DUF1540 domain-containing protein [Fibrobacter sp.]